MGKIFHIANDEKFIDLFIDLNNYFGLQNYSEFLIFSKYNTPKYVRSTNIQLIHSREKLKEKLKEASRDDILVFHSFRPYMADALNYLDSRITKIWIFWGFEGYLIFNGTRFIDYQTYSYYYKGIRKKIGYFYYKYLQYQNKVHGEIQKEIIRKMDIVATWCDYDIKLARKINHSIKDVFFNYYTKENMGWPDSDKLIISHNGDILLGNSASLTNNHVSALKYLKKIDFQGKIYTPLSYGSEKYRDGIINLGESLFGKSFIPITEFLPIEEYMSIFNKVEFVWMNHIRQQAAGNIFTALSYGKKVILHEKNVIRPTLKKWGIHVFNKNILKTKLPIREDLLLRNKTIIDNKLSIESNKPFFDLLKSALK